MTTMLGSSRAPRAALLTEVDGVPLSAEERAFLAGLNGPFFRVGQRADEQAADIRFLRRVRDPEVLALELDREAQGQGQERADRGRCAECGSELGGLWSMEVWGWAVYCRRDREHRGITTVQQRAVETFGLPAEIAEGLER